MLPNVKGWKPTRANVGHYWTSYWSNYASNINEQLYFNLLAYSMLLKPAGTEKVAGVEVLYGLNVNSSNRIIGN